MTRSGCRKILESAPQGRRRLQSFFPKSDVLLVMETLAFLSPHRRRQDTRGPNELFFPKRCSRDRAEAQETAGNTADGVQRKHEVTTKSHSGARFHLLPESTKRVWAHAGERAKMRFRKVSVAMGVGLDDKEILGAHSPNSQNR